MIQARLIVAILIAGAAFAGGWAVNGWRLGEQMAQYREQVTARAAQQVQKAQAESQQKQRALAALDKQHTQELADAKSQIADLSDAVAVGRRRLRVHAQCPDSVPQTTATTGVDDAAGARLDDAAERNYFRLRQRIETATRQVTGLQDYIRSVCR